MHFLRLFAGIILFTGFAERSLAQSWLRGKDLPDSTYGTPYVLTDKNDNNIVFTEGLMPRNDQRLIIKYDKYGNTIWTRKVQYVIANPQYPAPYSYIGMVGKTIDRNGNIYIASSSLVNFNGTSIPADTALSLFKISPNGDLLWKKTISDVIYSNVEMVCDSSFNLFIAGQVNSPFVRISDSLYQPAGGDAKVFVCRMDSSGKVKWTRFIKTASIVPYLTGSGSYINKILPKIGINNRQEVAVTGVFLDSVNINNVTLSAPAISPDMKKGAFGALFKSDGSLQYVRSIPIYAPDDFLTGQVLYDDRKMIFLYSGTDSTIGGAAPVVYRRDSIIFLDPAGNLVRKVTLKFGFANKYEAFAILKRDTGTAFYLGGHMDMRPNQIGLAMNTFLQIRKYDTSGVLLWSRKLPNANTDYTSVYKDMGFTKETITVIGLAFYYPPASYLLLGSDTIKLQNSSTDFMGILKEESNNISGRVYYDLNNNAVFDTGDRPASYFSLKTSAGSVFTDVAGYYMVYPSAGNFRDTAGPVKYYTTSPPAYSCFFPSRDSTIINQDFRFIKTGIVNDLSIFILPVTKASNSRDSWLQLHYSNQGTTVLSGLVKLKLPPAANMIISSPSPVYAVGDSIVWAFTNLNPGDRRVVAIHVGYSGLAGTWVKNIASIDPMNIDSNTLDNTDTLIQLLQGSYDPNNKLCNPVDSLNKSRVQSGKEWIEYVINFQNTGTDTATTVKVVDKLSPLLDLSGLEIMGSTHKFLTTLNGDLLTFEFPNIDLPDSTLNKPGSMGAISFRIKPKSTLANGDTIKNAAAIYFDFNEPVVTNTTTNYFKLTSTTAIIAVQGGNRQLQVFPNPVVRNELQFNLAGERITGRYNLRIIDMNGRVVQSSNINMSSSLNKISMHALHAGVYLVEIFNDKHKFAASFVKR